MLKDRGNKKWTPLMLPEHREALKKLWESRNDIEKPILDEQEKERLDILLQEAIRDQFTVKLLYYQNKRINTLKGKLKINKDYLYLNDKKIVIDNVINIILI